MGGDNFGLSAGKSAGLSYILHLRLHAEPKLWSKAMQEFEAMNRVLHLHFVLRVLHRTIRGTVIDLRR
jgi:hypothetical protein